MQIYNTVRMYFRDKQYRGKTLNRYETHDGEKDCSEKQHMGGNRADIINSGGEQHRGKLCRGKQQRGESLQRYATQGENTADISNTGGNHCGDKQHRRKTLQI